MTEPTPKRHKMASDPWANETTRGARGFALQLGRWARDHRRVARDSAIYVSARLGSSLLVWLLIGIALALPGGLYLLQSNLAKMSESWEGRPGISVYFKVDAEPELAKAMRDELAADPTVQRVTLITADAALAEFQQFTGVADALSHLDHNPLPASLRILLKEGSDAASFDVMATRLRAGPGVDEVSIEKTWLERVQAMTGLVRRLGWVLACTFALGAVLVTATSVRLAIESRLEELRVMKLVGATESYIRRPFLYFGLYYGLGGGIAGAMLISAVLVIVEAPLAALLGSYGQNVELVGLNAGFFVGLLGLGGILGVCGAMLAARQRLRGLQVI
jgi:cell division transport system permease protein